MIFFPELVLVKDQLCYLCWSCTGRLARVSGGESFYWQPVRKIFPGVYIKSGEEFRTDNISEVSLP
jgi:hypothetical protein